MSVLAILHIARMRSCARTAQHDLYPSCLTAKFSCTSDRERMLNINTDTDNSSPAGFKTSQHVTHRDLTKAKSTGVLLPDNRGGTARGRKKRGKRERDRERQRETEVDRGRQIDLETARGKTAIVLAETIWHTPNNRRETSDSKNYFRTFRELVVGAQLTVGMSARHYASRGHEAGDPEELHRNWCHDWAA